ncbi:hypothetical protein ACFSOV_11335 [Pedobacter petrophilus]|nr:hypothetical protein [Pedobacter petrophilus]
MINETIAYDVLGVISSGYCGMGAMQTITIIHIGTSYSTWLM